jgi:predicted TIM-barrel fold metal-dependent hydrolase
MKIIDADGHILDKEKDIRPYLPESYRRRGGSLVPSLGVDARLGGRFSDIECHDVPKRLRDMDTEGIDISVLFPTSSFAMSKIFERDYAVAYARAYNDYIAEVCKASQRIKAVALLPFQDPDASVKEINRAVTELGLAGVAVAPQGMREHLGSQRYWPIYQEIQRSTFRFAYTAGARGPRARPASICWHSGKVSQAADCLSRLRCRIGALLDGAHG